MATLHRLKWFYSWYQGTIAKHNVMGKSSCSKFSHGQFCWTNHLCKYPLSNVSGGVVCWQKWRQYSIIIITTLLYMAILHRLKWFYSWCVTQGTKAKHNVMGKSSCSKFSHGQFCWTNHLCKYPLSNVSGGVVCWQKCQQYSIMIKASLLCKATLHK